MSETNNAPVNSRTKIQSAILSPLVIALCTLLFAWYSNGNTTNPEGWFAIAVANVIGACLIRFFVRFLKWDMRIAALTFILGYGIPQFAAFYAWWWAEMPTTVITSITVYLAVSALVFLLPTLYTRANEKKRQEVELLELQYKPGRVKPDETLSSGSKYIKSYTKSGKPIRQ